MIRALFLSHDSRLYGAQRSLVGLLSRLDRSEIDAMVVAPYDGPLNDAIAAMDIPVTVRRIVHWIAAGGDARKSRLKIGQQCLSGLKARVWAMARHIENNQIDIVYTNTVISIEGALAAHITRRPHIWHLREQVNGNTQLKSPVPAWLIPYVVGRLSARAIVNSRYLGQIYARGEAKNKISVIYNGVDPAPFNLDRTEAARSVKTELGLNPAARLVILIGAVIPRKGQMLLARAAARVTRRFPDSVFLFVGEGDADYIREIRAFGEASGKAELLRFIGWRDDIPRLLAAADVLVVAADEEPFGRTVIEAMAAGTPVVSTRCGGPEEIVIDQVTGLLVPRQDVASLARSIERIFGDPADAVRMSQAARDRINKHFTLDAHAEQVQTVIAEVYRNSPTSH